MFSHFRTEFSLCQEFINDYEPVNVNQIPADKV